MSIALKERVANLVRQAGERYPRGVTVVGTIFRRLRQFSRGSVQRFDDTPFKENLGIPSEPETISDTSQENLVVIPHSGGRGSPEARRKLSKKRQQVEDLTQMVCSKHGVPSGACICYFPALETLADYQKKQQTKKQDGGHQKKGRRFREPARLDKRGPNEHKKCINCGRPLSGRSPACKPCSSILRRNYKRTKLY